VVAISEDLYQAMKLAGLPVGVSVLCPGFVRTGLMDAARNWPASFGEMPANPKWVEPIRQQVRRLVDQGMPPAAVADLVADAITADKFWVMTHPEETQRALARWQSIAEGVNPQVPDFSRLTAEAT